MRQQEEEEEEQQEYLALSKVRCDPRGFDGFDEQHPEIFQLQPAEVVLTHTLHLSSYTTLRYGTQYYSTVQYSTLC